MAIYFSSEWLKRYVFKVFLLQLYRHKYRYSIMFSLYYI